MSPEPTPRPSSLSQDFTTSRQHRDTRRLGRDIAFLSWPSVKVQFFAVFLIAHVPVV